MNMNWMVSAWTILLGLAAWRICPTTAAPWSFRWRSLNESDRNGLCSGTVQTSDLAAHFREALIDIALYQALGDTGSDVVPETCHSVQRMVDFVSKNLGTSSVCLNPHGASELNNIRQYLQLLQQQQPITVSSILAFNDYRETSGRLQRGFVDDMLTTTLTSGPSESELVSAAYQYIVERHWSYVGLVWEADLGADRLSQLLQASARSDRRVCFPLLLSFQSGNVTDAARALKEFVYTTKRLNRFTIVFAGSGAGFLRLWDLVSGTDDSYSDLEKRYQFVLIGDAFSSYHRMSDTTRRRNLALGTVFIFPGILDPDPSSDELRILFNNITSNPRSMGRFMELGGTHTRLNSLKEATNGLCSWSDVNSFCYKLALRYDFLALSLAALLNGGTPTLSSVADAQKLRQKVTTLSVLRTNLTILDSFIREGYISYSMEKGLQHGTRGYWQPIVKVYQSQLTGTSYDLVKLGELRVKQAGTLLQTYEVDVNSNRSQFYQLTNFNPEIFPTLATNNGSECLTSCPECVTGTAKQLIQFKEGDIYLGLLAPVNYKGNDVYDCSDGSFRANTVGGYEFAMAFKFVVDLVDTLSQGSTTFPPGFDVSKVDQQFLLGVKDLLQAVHERRTKRLKWGYVMLDTCYSSTCTVRRLGSLLDGTMGVIPGFNFTKMVGFVGAHSSTQTMAASQLLKMYNLPLITYGSTSTALSNTDLYPNVLRTVASDTVIIEAMVLMLKHLKVNYISVVYVPTAYGISLRDEMKSIASREGICISKLIAYDCGSEDEGCKRNKIFELKTIRARYVPFLCTLQDLISFLRHSQAESEIEYLTLLTTESVGISDAAFMGKKNVGLGTLSLKLVATPSPAFSAFKNYTLTRVPSNVNGISEWERLYFEDAQQCYLRESYIRNHQFSQICLQSLVETHPMPEVESRSPFVIDATSTLVLGTLTAMKYMCQVVTPEPACSTFFSSDFNSMQQRANLVMFGDSSTDPKPQLFTGVGWAYQKVFDNRMGRTAFSMWQYRKQGSVEYKFVQIGLFDGANTSTFTSSAETLQSMERGATGVSSPTATSPCRTREDCGILPSECVNPWPGPTAPSKEVPQSQLSLLGLLFIPGFLLGFLPVCFINLIRNGCFKGRSGEGTDLGESDYPTMGGAVSNPGAEINGAVGSLKLQQGSSRAQPSSYVTMEASRESQQ